MDVMSLLTWVGTIASIGSAIVAFWQATQSRNAADESKRVRAQLINQREASELAQVQAAAKRAQKSMEKYGPGSMPSSLAGVSFEKDAADVQEFLLLLREHRAHFGLKQPNEADEFCETLTPLLDSFAQASAPAELRQYGKQILIHLSTMSAVIKKQLEGKRENTF